jgi:hypothetical protein
MRWVAILMLVAACGADEPGHTKGEFCDAVSTATCDRASHCKLQTFDACFASVKAGCCLNNGTCAAAVTEADMKRADRCRDALVFYECSELQRGVLPATCLMN